ncbi:MULTISPECIES: phytoene desaturase family protein [Mycolicibacterium]|jgi:phytoene desaturase|uniref:Phytoene desaturase family protein n=1 Tax=Mycolicibacterium austroafricanum TaxID=39687 RepID=A0ABT8HK78_MYCAO|nr:MULTISPECIES: phytoene desaturase family protein [Mycolicibacterium]MDN4521169.1 phytoene desaturase family protein [Mycolicibacterium austroafricanum]MDW5610986.1 phytoene desaturase family protein [Mycolicibacterium sp. D5.8-2]UJL31393.1 phytoene desaturase [Mycolicibacterium vanbaalenii]WND58236.1 phytoene desaturase family protein [Mycolicibacterium vanbaalenii]
MMTRTLGGKTDRVVVVGAGLSGLSAALQLAGRGRQVTVLERGDHPGGRVGRADVNGYRLDTGPTVLTMPDIIDDAFAAVGESLADRLPMDPVHPAYHAKFADGSALAVHTEADAMVSEIERFAGRREADGYLRLREWLTKLYRTEFDGFIANNFDSPLSLLTPSLARLVALGGFRRWEPAVRRFLKDERLLRVFTFQSLYAGVPPQSALAVYAVIAYMDTVAGVYFPRGGMRALPDAMAAAASRAGVEFVYNATVSDLEFIGSRVTAVRTVDGGRVRADSVVLTTELPDTYRLIGRTPVRPLRLRPAPSAVVAHVGCRAVGPDADDAGHHTILFGDAWTQTFRDIIDDGRVMGDPSLLVTRPTATDPTLAPAGRDLLYVLAPAPNTDVGTLDWDAAGSGYVEQMLSAVRSRMPGVAEDAELLHVVTPADWRRQGMASGTPFALAHTFAQTGPFRPANTVRGIDNVVLAGSSTVPGVGVPTAILSGRLAADRITGIPVRPRPSEVHR